jgi:LCP family protein required for cell wall assembly
VARVHRTRIWWGDLKETDSGTRPAQGRKRWPVIVVVLTGLFLGLGVQAGVFLNDGAFEPTASAGRAQEMPEVNPASFGESQQEAEAAAAPVEKGPAPAFETEGDLVAARRAEPSWQASDEQASDGTREVSGEPLRVLVLGVDQRPETSEGSATRSDTMMLVQVTPQTGRIELLSVPRDLLVEVEPGVQDRINTAYAYGGVEQATAVMEGLTGISIDRYAIVDFGGFEDVVNALGGVTVEVGQPIRIGIEGRRVYIPSGRQELNGLEALAYARYRGTPCGDLDRIERQQRLVAALREQALGWNTITKLPRIVVVANQNVDTDLGIVQAISLGRALVGNGGQGGLRSSQLKGTPETLPNGDAVLVPDEQANERILEHFRNTGPTVSRPERAPRPEVSPARC